MRTGTAIGPLWYFSGSSLVIGPAPIQLQHWDLGYLVHGRVAVSKNTATETPGLEPLTEQDGNTRHGHQPRYHRGKPGQRE